MLLAIDVGNTNIVFAAYAGGEQKSLWRLQTESERSSDEYAVFLKQVFELAGLSFTDISGVIICSVVPAADRRLALFSKDYLGCDPIFVTHDMAPIDIDVVQPSQVGADRLVNAIAVKGDYALPAVVIDFGTATTFDVIDADGAYSGGVIAPGIHLSIEALARATAKLPKVNVCKTETVIGKSTDQAIQAGIFWGYVGLIEKIVGQITEELGQAPHVIATGGLAPLFAQHIDCISDVDDSLTLKGLVEIYEGL